MFHLEQQDIGQVSQVNGKGKHNGPHGFQAKRYDMMSLSTSK